MTPIEFVQNCPPFDCLSEGELRLVEQTLELLKFPPSTYILRREGAPSAYLYLIRSGIVQFLHKGKEIDTMGSGDSFGYPSMLLQGSPNLDAISRGHVIVYGIPESTFRELVNHQTFAEFYLRDLSLRLQETWAFDAPSLGSDLARPIDTLVKRSPIVVPPEKTIQEVALMMREQNISSVLVEGDLPGIVTIHALCNRVLAEGLGPETNVQQIMSHPVQSISADTPIYGALLFMIEERVNHLPLTQAGQITGIITSGDLLRYQARSPLYLLLQLDNLESTRAIVDYSVDVTRTVEGLFDDGLQVDQIARIVASLNDALMKRLLKLIESELGPPPTPYAWLVLGSEGRMEQTLLTDQDNALVYLEDSREANQYFTRLANRMVKKLIEIGFPPCPGGYTASNWCYPLVKWEQLFNGWINRPEPQALLEAAIFFDFRRVHGVLTLEPLEKIVEKAKNNPIFLAQMARTALAFVPPLGFFRSIRNEEGQVDLKKGGIAPIVSMARMYAIEAGVPILSTLERLQAAAEAGVVSREGATFLSEAFRYLLWLRLREQLREVNAGEAPDHKIHLDRLLAWEKRHLREALAYIRDMQDVIELRFRISPLG